MIVNKTARADRARKGVQLLVSAAVLGLIAPIAAQAQETTPRQESGRAVRVSIPAQPLDSALTALADQAGLKILFSSGDVAGLHSNGLSGAFAPADALSRLLAGSGFTFRFVGVNAVTLERAPQVSEGSVQLGPVRVEGASGTGGTGIAHHKAVNQRLTTEGTRSYTTRGTAAATRLPLTLRETPQSVSVLTNQQIEDRGLISLDEALKNVTGISIEP